MKNGLIVGCIFLLFLSCTGKKNNGIKFNPKQRESSMSEIERQNAIAQKRSELGNLNIDSILFSDNITLTILPPAVCNNVSERMSDMVLYQMLQISTQNSVSGVGGDPCFVFVANLDLVNKKVVNTIPQKISCAYRLSLYIGNFITKEIYESYSMEIKGVGNSFEEAAVNAANNIGNTKEIQAMIQGALPKITNWYIKNYALFKSRVEGFIAQHEYGKAYILLDAVPSSATECYKFACTNKSKVADALFKQQASENLDCFKDAVTSAGCSYNPLILAYYKLLPAGSKEKQEATKIYESYMKNVGDAEKEKLQHQMKMEENDINYKQLLVQEKISENQKMAAQYEYETTRNAELTSAESNGGLFDNIISKAASSGIGKLVQLVLNI